MTNDLNNTPFGEIYEILCEHGFDGLAEGLELLLNEAMKIERAQHLQAAPYERTGKRRGYANGFKPKRVKTRVGELSLAVPQVRDSDFYPQSLEKGLRSERALKVALAEMYVQGVSTRKMNQVIKEMCGFEISSMAVSRAAKALDEQLNAWRNRPLGETPYLLLDARYEKVRNGGQVANLAVLIAVGIRADGRREVLGCSVSLSEQEIHWRTFLKQLVQRGLHGVKMITSDAHEGLKQARKAVLPAVPWQRCLPKKGTHLQRNAGQYVPRQEMRAEVAADIRTIFNAPNRPEADRFLQQFIERWERKAPQLVRWAEENLPQGLTVMALPQAHQKRLRTTNAVERLNREIKRRTRVVSLFPNPESCLRLVTALLMETSEEWQTGYRYLKME